jgi:hypothetical protein
LRDAQLVLHKRARSLQEKADRAVTSFDLHWSCDSARSAASAKRA